MFYSQAPWPQRTKLGTNVAKGIICDVDLIFGVPPLLNTITQGGFTGKNK